MSDGLEDIIAARTILSDVDGANGHLVIRGYPLDQLAGHIDFEGVCHLLFAGFFADMPDITDFRARLASARHNIFNRLAPHFHNWAGMPVYDGMRAAIALLPDGDNFDCALEILAAPAVLVPALLRQQQGSTPIAPDGDRTHAHDVMHMLGAGDIGPLASALDSYLVTVSDHGLNASTFATRVVASTRAGLVSSVLAGLGALKGPLHGGAPGPVIDMLDRLASETDPADWFRREIAKGERIMGFGHRIYRTRDPRADALKSALRKLDNMEKRSARLTFAEDMEKLALETLRMTKPDRILETNVEYYTALLLEAAGFPSDCFTAVFAMGRMAGWIAHAQEQKTGGRLIRPQSRYVGPTPKMAA